METYVATSVICVSESWPLNAGIPPPPFVTCLATAAIAGLSWSRFGPTVPVAPASLSVWHVAQFEVKTVLPAAASPLDDLDEDESVLVVDDVVSAGGVAPVVVGSVVAVSAGVVAGGVVAAEVVTAALGELSESELPPPHPATTRAIRSSAARAAMAFLGERRGCRIGGMLTGAGAHPVNALGSRRHAKNLGASFHRRPSRKAPPSCS